MLKFTNFYNDPKKRGLLLLYKEDSEGQDLLTILGGNLMKEKYSTV